MSRENLELVRSLQPSPDADLVELLRDEAKAAAVMEAVAPAFHRDVEMVGHTAEGPQTHTGLPGIREGWLDWLSPWANYRVEVEDVIDRGEEVVVLTRDLGRYRDSNQEVSVLARVEFFSDRTEALEAVGLRE